MDYVNFTREFCPKTCGFCEGNKLIIMNIITIYTRDYPELECHRPKLSVASFYSYILIFILYFL